jgi:NADPH-dependent glutamate synthase beta subunit-like oxidoreductase
MVVVIGGGNVAVDAAVMAHELGAERVVILYRRTLEEMPAWRPEYLEAAGLGIEFRWLSTVKATRLKAGKLCAVEVQPMRRIGMGSDGRRGAEPDPDAATYELRCDELLLALGQVLEPDLPKALRLPIEAEEVISVVADGYLAGGGNVFAAGDAVSGGSTVVASLGQGMAAARAIHKWLVAKREDNNV